MAPSPTVISVAEVAETEEIEAVMSNNRPYESTRSLSRYECSASRRPSRRMDASHVVSRRHVASARVVSRRHVVFGAAAAVAVVAVSALVLGGLDVASQGASSGFAFAQTKGHAGTPMGVSEFDASSVSGGSMDAAVSTPQEEWRAGVVPRFYQVDQQWSNRKYGQSTIAEAGCGPVCLSMVYVGLTGKDNFGPERMAEFAECGGFLDDGLTTWDLMSTGAGMLGLQSAELSADAAALQEAVSAGQPVIASMRPGTFTTTGHFIVIAGMTEDGSMIVHDPNSPERSCELWDASLIVGECANMWAFSA